MHGVYNIMIIRQRLYHIHMIIKVSLKFDTDTAQTHTHTEGNFNTEGVCVIYKASTQRRPLLLAYTTPARN